MDHFKKHFATATPDTNIPRLCPSSKKDSAASKRPSHVLDFSLRVDTDDESVAPLPEKQQQKKRAIKSDIEPFDRTAKGMFFMKDINAPPGDIFPRGMRPLICAISLDVEKSVSNPQRTVP